MCVVIRGGFSGGRCPDTHLNTLSYIITIQSLNRRTAYLYNNNNNKFI